MAGQNYRGLIVWQKAMDLVEYIYGVTKSFPKEELYGLTNQLRRAVVSIPSNIAEGQGRHSPNQFLQFLAIAHGSLREVETQILIAERLAYIDGQKAQKVLELTGEVGKLLVGLSKSLRG